MPSSRRWHCRFSTLPCRKTILPHEWCWGWYGSAYYGTSPSSNPSGPASGSYRVIRGVDWYRDGSSCASADRNYNNPSNRSNYHFFVLSWPQASSERSAELGPGELHHVADELGFGQLFSQSDAVPSIPSIRSNLSIHTPFGSPALNFPAEIEPLFPPSIFIQNPRAAIVEHPA